MILDYTCDSVPFSLTRDRQNRYKKSDSDDLLVFTTLHFFIMNRPHDPDSTSPHPPPYPHSTQPMVDESMIATPRGPGNTPLPELQLSPSITSTPQSLPPATPHQTLPIPQATLHPSTSATDDKDDAIGDVSSASLFPDHPNLIPNYPPNHTLKVKKLHAIEVSHHSQQSRV